MWWSVLEIQSAFSTSVKAPVCAFSNKSITLCINSLRHIPLCIFFLFVCTPNCSYYVYTAAVCYPAVCSVCSWCNCSSVLRLVSSGTGLAAKHLPLCCMCVMWWAVTALETWGNGFRLYLPVQPRANSKKHAQWFVWNVCVFMYYRDKLIIR